MPDRSEGARPARARRASVSWTVNPQSSMTQVPPASARSALPRLPLPNEAKRKALLQLLLQQGENSLGRVRGIGAAVLVEDPHLARLGVAVLDEHAVLPGLRVRGIAPEH